MKLFKSLCALLAFLASSSSLLASTLSLPAATLRIQGIIGNLAGTIYSSDVTYTSNVEQNNNLSFASVPSTGIHAVSSGTTNAISAATSTSSVSDEESPDFFTQTFVGVDLKYSFALVGPNTSQVIVPITIDANLSAGVGGNNAVSAGGILTVADKSYDVGATCCVSVRQQVSVHDMTSILTNEIYSVEMDADAYAQAANGTGTQGFVSIDPFFSISPGLAAEGYSFVFSPGIANGTVTTVPLPGSAPMFGVTLIAFGAFRYRLRCRKIAGS